MELKLLLKLIKQIPVGTIKEDKDCYGSVVQVLLREVKKLRDKQRSVSDSRSKFQLKVEARFQRKIALNCGKLRHDFSFDWSKGLISVCGKKFPATMLNVCDAGVFTKIYTVTETQFGTIYSVMLYTKLRYGELHQAQSFVFKLNDTFGDKNYYHTISERAGKMAMKKKAFDLFSSKLES